MRSDWIDGEPREEGENGQAEEGEAAPSPRRSRRPRRHGRQPGYLRRQVSPEKPAEERSSQSDLG